MSDYVKYMISVVPVEELTDENSGTHYIISGEVGRTLGSQGNSLPIADYSGTAANQGYKDGAVNYKVASHSAGGTALSGERSPDFIYIENTGYKFSSATALGASTTDYVMVAVKDTLNSFYYEVAWLAPGSGVVLTGGGSTYTIADFGGSGGDLHYLNGQGGVDSPIQVRTYQSDGSAATSGNAIKYLVVK